MINVSVTTTMAFENLEDYQRYADSPELARAIGFREELKEAHKTQQPVVIETHRPHYGTTVKTVVEVSDPTVVEELKAAATKSVEKPKGPEVKKAK